MPSYPCRAIGCARFSLEPLEPSPKTMLLISMLRGILVNASPTPLHLLASLSRSHPPPHRTQTIGRILSWTSTALYLGSCYPRFYKNFRRRFTVGLSSTLFIVAFFGDLFYSGSLFDNPLAWFFYPLDGLHG